MFRNSLLLFWLIACSGFVISAAGQSRLSDSEAADIAPAFESHSSNSLKCGIVSSTPELDFDFRFVTGYFVHCRLSLFEGRRTVLNAYLKVTPKGKSPVVLGAIYHLPQISSEMLSAVGGDVRKLKNEVGTSGAFWVGPGEYSVEILMKDDRNRMCRKKWRLRAGTKRSERDVQLAIQPLVVEAIDQKSWNITNSRDAGRLRLTILLDAAPINPYQSRLRAWDRAFLLECVYSVLRQTPHSSVRLIAFNLDQQREIFRTAEFGTSGFLSLSRALEDIETASISVEALKQRNSPQLLANLANHELAEAEPPDAIIFLGANSPLDVDVGPGLLTAKKPDSPSFFYFEYTSWPGAPFPDVIQRLTKVANGKTYLIHSPAQLDQAIQKMLAQLKQK